jgi:AcrR family transcriptional regulator
VAEAPASSPAGRVDADEAYFLGALDIAGADLLSRVRAASECETAWIGQVRGAVQEMLTYPRAHPTYARIVYVKAVRSGARARASLDRDVEVLVDLIDRGRGELDDPDSLTRATAEGLAGAVYELISMRLVRGAGPDLSELLPQLMFMVARPYLGLEAALAEFRRAA